MGVRPLRIEVLNMLNDLTGEMTPGENILDIRQNLVTFCSN